jgi:hypothetical protein
VSIGRRSVTQDPIEQALDKLGALGVPVNDIGEKAGAIVGQLGSFDLFEILDQVTSIDPSQIDVGDMLAELKSKYDDLDPALKVPVAIAAGFVGARVVRWIVR